MYKTIEIIGFCKCYSFLVSENPKSMKHYFTLLDLLILNLISIPQICAQNSSTTQFAVNKEISILDKHCLKLSNTVLENELYKYCREVDTATRYYHVPILEISKINRDIVVYTFRISFTALTLEYNPFAFFVKIDNTYVPVIIVGAIFKECFPFEVSRDVLFEFMELYFPNEYSYYQQYSEFPPPPIGHIVEWEITFKRDKLIKKEIIGF